VYLKPSNTTSPAGFGKAVAISDDGSTLAVGTPSESNLAQGVNAPQSGSNADNVGAAYVFARSGTTWTQESYIKATNAEGADQFGFAIALSSDGDKLVVTAPGESGGTVGISPFPDGDASSHAGAAYLFIRSQSGWHQSAYIKAPNPDTGDFLGFAAAISADGATIALGATSEDSSATGVNGVMTDNSASNSGAVYLY
jgi:hypothetical protein